MTGKEVARGLVVGLGLVASFVPALVAAKGKGASLLLPWADMKFEDAPDMAGAQLAKLQGDPATGPSHFMLRYAAGFMAPMHHHSAKHWGTVVAGTLVLGVDGKEQRLAPGSFFGFSGGTPHATRCEAGVDCLVSMDVRGKWDVVPDKALASK